MKKILFLLLLTVASYGQTLQNPTYGTVKLKNNTQSTTATKVNVQEADGEIRFRDKEIFTENSAGAISGFALTNNGDGTVNIASGFALLRATNDENGILQKYLIPAVTNLALTDNVNNYVIVQYNAGTPNMVVITDPNLITTTNNTLIYVIARYGTNLNYLYTGEQNVDSNGKLRRRFLNIEPIKRAAGAVIGFTNRIISTTAGLFYGGLTPYTTPLLGATFTNAYNNGSVWTRQAGQTQVNNTQYNLNGVLTAMSSNRFRTDFVYIMVNNPSVLYTVMGTSQANSLADARLVTMPSALPVELQRLGVLVGRLIIRNGDAAITEVSSAYEITFNAATVINHNDTGNIQGGAVGDYQHVTTTEKNTWNGKADLNSPAFTGTPTAPTPTTATGIANKGYVDGLDANNVKLTGSQIVTGAKSFTGGISSQNTSTGIGIYSNNISTGQGINSNNNSTGVGILSDNNSTGRGILANNSSTGIGIKSDNYSSGNGIVSNQTSTGTGLNYVGQNNGTNTFTVDKLGNVTATAHVTTGGTTAQFVDGTGALQNKSQFQPAISGTANFLTKYGVGGLAQSQVFDNGTNVGIGTNNPASSFHIYKSASSLLIDGLRVERDPSTTSSSIFNAFGGASNIISNSGQIGVYNPTILWRTDGTTSIENLRITPLGNLLVNTPTDNAIDKAQINGSVQISTFMYLTPSTAPSTPRAGTVYYDSGTNKLRCWNGTTWNDLF